MRSTLIRLPAALLAASLLAGCGERKPPARPSRPSGEPTAQPTRPEPQPQSEPRPEPARPPSQPEPAASGARDAAFEKKLAEILAMERQADFSKALVLAREAREEFRQHPRVVEIQELSRRLLEEKRAAIDLPFAVQNLTSDDLTTVRVAERKLIHAGEAGRIFLRRAIQDEDSAVAGGAARVLGKLRDTQAIPALLARLRKEEGRTPYSSAASEALNAMAEDVPADLWPEIYRLLREDDGIARVELSAALAGLHEEVCEGDDARFLETIGGDPAGLDVTREHFGRAMTSTNAALVAWACERGRELRPYLHALKAEYFRGTGFQIELGKGFDSRLDFGNNASMGVPGGRTADFSIRWTGKLWVPADGKYTFIGSAYNWADLYINEEKVLHADSHTRSGAMELTRGYHDMRVMFAVSGDRGRLSLQWEGPGVGRTAAIPLRVRPWPEVVMSLHDAVADLTSTNTAVLRQAERDIVVRGGVGRMFLRAAARRKPMETARAALRPLVLWGDRRVTPMLFDRIREWAAETPAPPALVEALNDLGARMPDYLYGRLLAALKEDAREMSPYAAGLCGGLLRGCDGSETNFNRRAGSADAYALVERHVRQALASTDEAAVLRACEHGVPFVSMLTGLRGEYFIGRDFDLPARRSLDRGPSLPGGKMPLRRQQETSARWTGFLRIDRPGEYTFYVRGENECRLWVDDTHVVRGTHQHHHAAGKLTLDPGLRRIRCELRVSSGTPSLELTWAPPGGGRTGIPADRLLTPAWSVGLERLAASAQQLASNEEEPVGAAKDLIRAMMPVSRHVLRKLARDAGEDVALAAVEMLVDLRDEGAVDHLLQRLDREPAQRLAPSVCRGLGALAGGIPRDALAGMLENLKRQETADMGAWAAALCGVLERSCGGEAERFDERVGRAGACGELERYVLRARRSPEPAVVERVCVYGAPIAGYTPGVRAEYYMGYPPGLMWTSRLERAVNVERDALKRPDGRLDGLSARWTGRLPIETAGEYYFVGRTRQRVKLWLDGRIVVSAAGYDRGVRTNLNAGSYGLRVDYHQKGGERYGLVNWSGPAVPRERNLGDDPACTPLSPSEFRGLRRTADLLASAQPDAAAAARAAINRHDPASRVVLVHTLLHGQAEAAAHALDLLTYRGEGSVAADLMARWREGSGKSSEPRTVRGLRAFASDIGAEDLAWLDEQLASRQKQSVDAVLTALCSVFQDRCGGKPGRYNALLEDEQAYRRLASAVDALLASADIRTVLDTCVRGGAAVGLQPGWYARYYEGAAPEKLVLERVEQEINLQNGRFPHPEKRQEQVSAMWSGVLDVPTNGAYKFFVGGDDWARVRLDGRELLDTRRGDAEKQVELTAGLHPLRVVFSQGAQSLGCWLDWSGPGIERQKLSERWVRMPFGREDVAGLPAAVEALSAEDLESALAARRELIDAGAAGTAVLLHALRHGPDASALTAARLLADLNDPKVAGLVLGRLKQGPDEAVLPGFVGLLCEQAERLPEGLYAEVFAALKQDQREMSPYASILCSGLLIACDGSRERFNKLVGSDGAYDALRQHVEQALVSADQAAVLRACEYGAPFASMLRGLRAAYYLDQEWFRPQANRHEATTALADNRAPLPRQTEISARWTGFLEIEQPGEYVFALAAEGPGEVWIDGRSVIRNAVWRHVDSEKIELSAGLHRIEIGYRKGGGTARLSLRWTPPGGQRSDIPRDALRTRPWARDLARLAEGIGQLASDEEAVLGKAKEHIRKADPVSRYLLHKTVRDAEAPVAHAAADMLVAMDDRDTVAFLLQRLARKPDERLADSMCRGLNALAGGIQSGAVRVLAAKVSERKEADMGAYAAALCGLLDTACEGDAARYNKLAGGQEAYGKLADYVARARRAPDPAVVARVCSYAVPLIECAPGARADCYLGYQRDKLWTSRFFDKLAVDRDQLKHPDGRVDNLSVRLTGRLRIEEAGEYKFTLRTRQRATLSIDGRTVAEADGRDVAEKWELTAGDHSVRLDYHQGSGDRWCSVEWMNPKNQSLGALDGRWLRTPLWPSEVERLREATDSLGSGEAKEVAAGRALIHRRDPASRVVLGHALRHSPSAQVAMRALDLLRFRSEDAMGGELMVRLKERPDLVSEPRTVKGLHVFARALSKEDAAWLYGRIKGREDARVDAAVSGLCGVLQERCGGERERFDALLGEGGAYDRLAAHIERALASADTAQVLAACEFGGVFIGFRRGWQARYFEGREPERAVLRRIDAQIEVRTRRFPHPENRQDNVSAEWTGLLKIEQAGKYAFRASADDMARLWIDGEVALDTGRGEQEEQLDLKPGLHPVRLVFRQQDSNCSVWLNWSGPGIDGQRLSHQWVRCPYREAELAELRAAVQALAGKDAKQAMDARQALVLAGPAGALLLRHALRHGSDNEALSAARLLSVMFDERVAGLIVQRLKRKPPAAVAGHLMELLELPAARLSDADCAWLYDRAAVEGAKPDRTRLAVLCAAADLRYQGRTNEFNRAVKDAQGMQSMRRAIGRMLVSPDRGDLDWAVRHGGPFVPKLEGAELVVYDDPAFGRPVQTSRVSNVRIDRHRFPHPGGKRDRVCARFRGCLAVPQKGKYRFAVTAAEGARLWVGGNLPADAWRNQSGREVGARVVLDQGTHAVTVLQWQETANGSLSAVWEGPGVDRRRLGGPDLSTAPVASDVETLNDLLEDLASEDANLVNRARQRLERREFGAVGPLYLRHALRWGPPEGVPASAAVLYRLKDPSVTGLVAARIAQDPKVPVEDGLVKSLLPELEQIDLKHWPLLLKAVTADARFERRELLTLFERALAKLCDKDPAKLGELTGAPDAVARLQDYVGKAAASTDQALSKWGKGYRGAFKPPPEPEPEE